ncbi:hypothetical protein CCAN2_1800004 [Capnocytophaga canimorsus]|nr:hypothetical protein CCAN2_1800004 [Capnocytophaga canimorsus]
MYDFSRLRIKPNCQINSSKANNRYDFNITVIKFTNDIYRYAIDLKNTLQNFVILCNGHNLCFENKQ